MTNLPNIYLRSILTFLSLYGLLFFALVISIEYVGVDFQIAFAIVVVISGLHFLISPAITSVMLRWFYKMHWVSRNELPTHLAQFVEKISKEQGIDCPKFGIIDDKAPEAFTYGISPNSARIVISKGLIELLEPDELESVIAHEIGHAVHWDMLVMTVAQLIPMALYFLFRILMGGGNKQKKSSNNKGSGHLIMIAIIIYILYIISHYIILSLSRTREYYADRFSGKITKNPASLANALIKIAYGLIQEQSVAKNAKEEKRSSFVESLEALNIFSIDQAYNMPSSIWARQNITSEKALDSKKTIGQTMAWDLENPWAKIFELNSTHPLTAKRLLCLAEQAKVMGVPYVGTFVKKESSYSLQRFFFELIIAYLPRITTIITALTGAYLILTSYENRLSVLGSQNLLPEITQIVFWFGISVIVLGASKIIKARFIYPNKSFKDTTVVNLLKNTDVSPVNPITCTLRGKIIGKGRPGYVFSKDLMLQDESGIIFVRYTQPFSLLEFIFSIGKANSFIGKDIFLEGWFYRGPRPYIDMKKLEARDGLYSYSLTPIFFKAKGLLISLLGIIILIWNMPLAQFFAKAYIES